MTCRTTYKLEEEDFVFAQRLNYWRRLPKSLSSILIALVVMFGFFLAAGMPFADLANGALVGALLGGVFLFLYMPQFGVPAAARKLAYQARRFHEQVELSWSPNEIEFKSEQGNGKFLWVDFHRWAEDRRVLLLYANDSLFYLIPRRALNNVEMDDIHEAIEKAGLRKR